ncbi:MAG: disulfide bond formation protein B [Alphaproteobacteria bacterium]|nr:disulfide bond formation protein B [Alphaproteobacteria bacterium]
MINFVTKLLSCPKFMPLAMAGIAAASLGMALMAQYVFGLEPCILCLIQRYPYGIVIALGLLGFAFSFKCRKGTSVLMALSGIAFLANSVIAFYHTGVELHWWKSHLEGCAVPDLGSDPNSILATIQASTAVRCDEIPWADPILGLSMANYNVIFCAGLGIIALISAWLMWRKS